MYAVIFDITSNCLCDYSDNSIVDTYGDIRKFMESNGFSWQQGSVYFGEETVNAVNCVVIIQKLVKLYPWLSVCLKDIRMLRIDENTSLMLAIS